MKEISNEKVIKWAVILNSVLKVKPTFKKEAQENIEFSEIHVGEGLRLDLWNRSLGNYS